MEPQRAPQKKAGVATEFTENLEDCLIISLIISVFSVA